MDIRTKLVFALVAVTLGSMLAFGAFMYRTADRMVGESTAQQLQGLVESSADALESIEDGWRERVLLIASRTQLRISLREYGVAADPEIRERIERILADAAGAVRSVAGLAVYGVRGALVTEVGLRTDALDPALAPRFSPGALTDVLFVGAAITEDGYPRVAYTTPLTLDGERIGYLLVVLNGNRLLELTGDYTGMGETGELLIVMPDPEGARTLHPVRHVAEGEEAVAGVLLTGARDPAVRSLTDSAGVWTRGLVDYRGEDVWAATRFLKEPGWGLAVKFDAREKRTSIHEFREELVSLALALAGIGMLVAVFLGFRFAAPIHNLAEAATEIGDGNLDARATVQREDEIGFLARTFNEMAEALQAQVLELHEFQKFFDVSLDMLCIAGTDGYFKRCNPAFERVLGWSSEDLLKQPFLDLIHPDDVRATEQEIASLSEGIPTISFVNRFRCSDGSWKWLRWNSYPDPDTGLLYAIARETRVQPES